MEQSPQTEIEKATTDFFLSIGDLLLEVRRDLGYKRTSLKREDIIRNVIRDIDEYAKKHDL